ncbi:hypothetical protein PoB_001617200 [Plakobranchus ocellatus]|uniref:Uncharacterized protein n=1 Tax=Plakobranchus ocellatus TaxID=259542 RepID=A0AAV3Z516_9GAST|nr:hypothetical protein PoB_001617200 [Plakobranchus ocellatus]
MALCDLHQFCLTLIPVLGVMLTNVSFSIGQDNGQPNATLVFDNLYNVTFPSSSLERFFQCLCNKNNKICRHSYNHVIVFDYEADANPESQDFSEGDATGNTFICHPGRFAPVDAISCVRSSEAFDWCNRVTYCRPVFVNLTFDASCDFSCVNIQWIATSLESRHFADTPELEEGTCGVILPTNEPESNKITTPVPSSSTEVPVSNPTTTPALSFCSNETSAGAGNLHQGSSQTSLLFALIVGWVVVAILIIMIVAFLVYRRYKRRVWAWNTNEKKKGVGHPTENGKVDLEKRETEAETGHEGSNNVAKGLELRLPKLPPINVVNEH